MKSLKNYITEASADFPAKNAWKKKSGIISIRWDCGNEAAQEYLRSAIGAYDTEVAVWFNRCISRIDTISMSIFDDGDDGITAYIYFNVDIVGGRSIRFEGSFDSVKDAKVKMYDLLCKIRDDKDILRKMKRVLDPDPDKLKRLGFDEMINL